MYSFQWNFTILCKAPLSLMQSKHIGLNILTVTVLNVYADLGIFGIFTVFKLLFRRSIFIFQILFYVLQLNFHLHNTTVCFFLIYLYKFCCNFKLNNSRECRYFCVIYDFNENSYSFKPLNKFIIYFWWDIIFCKRFLSIYLEM